MAKKPDLPHLPYLQSRIYYAQNREDLVLDAFFRGRKKGFFVDIGAYDPDYDSVTKMFYKRGWKGINIEPQPDRFKLFEKARKRDVNLNVGIAEKKGTLTLRSYKNQGLSTFSQDMKDEYEEVKSAETEEYTDIDVPVVTLASVLEEHAPETIEFMKIDVEGFEEQVIRSNDWKKFRPQVLCIEVNHSTEALNDLLIDEVGYEGVFFDGLNAYYVDPDTQASKDFDYVTHVIEERGGGLPADILQYMQNYSDRIGELEHMLASADKELKYKQGLLEAAESRLEELQDPKAAKEHYKNVKRSR